MCAFLSPFQKLHKAKTFSRCTCHFPADTRIGFSWGTCPSSFNPSTSSEEPVFELNLLSFVASKLSSGGATREYIEGKHSKMGNTNLKTNSSLNSLCIRALHFVTAHVNRALGTSFSMKKKMSKQNFFPPKRFILLVQFSE